MRMLGSHVGLHFWPWIYRNSLVGSICNLNYNEASVETFKMGIGFSSAIYKR